MIFGITSFTGDLDIPHDVGTRDLQFDFRDADYVEVEVDGIKSKIKAFHFYMLASMYLIRFEDEKKVKKELEKIRKKYCKE